MKQKAKKILIVLSALGAAVAGLGVVAAIKKPDSVYDNEPEQKNLFEGKQVIFVPNEKDKENADGERGHLEAVGVSAHKADFYEKYLKRGLDIVLSSCGLIILSPLLAAIALAIKIDDPGPVLFAQKRTGKNKKYFNK